MSDCVQVVCVGFCAVIVVGALLGVLAFEVLCIVVFADYTEKTYYMPVDCFNCANPVVEKFNLGYASTLNCTYTYDGVDKTASIRYPGNAPWAYRVSESEATSWATVNLNNNLTCYMQNPSDNSFGYQVLISPFGWFVAFLVFGGVGGYGGYKAANRSPQ